MPEQSDPQDFHRNFVFSENIRIEDKGEYKRLVVREQYQYNILRNLIQFTKIPLSKTCRYYHAYVIHLGDEEWGEQSANSYIMFGLNGRCYIGKQQWKADESIRYHSNDGGVFNGGPGLKTDNPYLESSKIGCYLEYLGPQRSLVNFFKDDKIVFRQWVNLPGDQLYATIGFVGEPIEMNVYWPDARLKGPELTQESLRHWIGFRHILFDQAQQTFWLNEYDDAERLAFAKQAPRPLSKDKSYFEIEIMNIEDIAESIAMGLTSAVTDKHRLPGWDMPSIGYHADEGAIFYGSGEAVDFKDDQLKCRVGDKMGCGIIYNLGGKFEQNIDAASASMLTIDDTAERAEQSILVYFTKNKKVISQKCIQQPEGGFYPSVGFCRKGDKVKVDMDAEAPVITQEDIDDWSKTRASLGAFRFLPTVQFVDFEIHKGRKVRLRDKEKKHSLVQYIEKNLSSERPYWTATIEELSNDALVWIGVASAKFPQEGKALGIDPHSCGYQSKTGTIMSNGEKRSAPTFGIGDEVGCFMEYIGLTYATVVFTLNGTSVHRCIVQYEKGEQLYASVVMAAGNIKMDVNWPDIVTVFPDFQANNLSLWMRTKGLDVLPDSRLKSVGEEKKWVAHSCIPFADIGLTYFQVHIVKGPVSALPGIGFCTLTSTVDNRLGLEKGSVCFYPTDGVIYDNGDSKPVRMTHKITSNDIIGCGVVYAENADMTGRDKQNVVVYFTVNGQDVSHFVLEQPKGGLYPALCIPTEGMTIEVQMNAEPPALTAKTLCSWREEIGPDTEQQEMDDTQLSLLAGEMLSDVINYTSVLIDNRTLKNRPATLANAAAGRTGVYISHSSKASEVDKARQILQGLSEEGYLVEMSLWNPTLETVNEKADSMDVVIICLSNTYCNQDAMLHEFIILKSKGKRIVPIIISETQWPPKGKLANFGVDFLTAEYYKLDFSNSDIAIDQVISNLKSAKEGQGSQSSSANQTPTSKKKPSNHSPLRAVPEHSSEHLGRQNMDTLTVPMAIDEEESQRGRRRGSSTCTIL